jgi:hypothetical protein
MCNNMNRASWFTTVFVLQVVITAAIFAALVGVNPAGLPWATWSNGANLQNRPQELAPGNSQDARFGLLSFVGSLDGLNQDDKIFYGDVNDTFSWAENCSTYGRITALFVAISFLVAGFNLYMFARVQFKPESLTRQDHVRFDARIVSHPKSASL